jgi:glycine/D-amino acid oxidase-like deaminating enzyme
VTTALAESHYDAVVVGLGAWGSAALCHLARRGLRVLGVDRYRPPHRRGSHHGQGRIIRRASFESARNTGLVARSYELWEDLPAGLGAPLLAEVGGINIGPLDHSLVAGALAAYRARVRSGSASGGSADRDPGRVAARRGRADGRVLRIAPGRVARLGTWLGRHLT